MSRPSRAKNARPLGVTNTPKHRVANSDYQWNHRPSFEYAGAARVIHGREVDARSFSIRTTSSAGITWTVYDQAWAVEQGFFVQREVIRERPVIVHVNPYASTFHYLDPIGTMREIERRLFRCEPGYARLMRFIEQQDRYGYTGAWDKRIMNFTPDLIWYKLFKQEQRGRDKRRAQLQANAHAAREARHNKRVRNLVLYGKATIDG